MKAKKIIIWVVSAILVVAIAGGAYFAIAADRADMTVGKYWASLTKNRETVISQTLVTVNGEDISIFGVESAIYLYAALDMPYGDYIDKDIELLIDRTLLSQEGRRRGLVVSKEEVDQFVAGQKEIINSLEADDPTRKAYFDYFESMNMTMDECYDSEAARSTYANHLLYGKALEDECKKQGAETPEEKQKVREELVQKLRATATIIYNTENYEKVKKQAVEMTSKSKS